LHFIQWVTRIQVHFFYHLLIDSYENFRNP
jgi:hypothetical protein